MLFGSNVLPAMIWCGNKELQLGDFVRRAVRDSGLTDEKWNALTEQEREYKIIDAVYAMRTEAKVDARRGGGDHEGCPHDCDACDSSAHAINRAAEAHARKDK